MQSDLKPRGERNVADPAVPCIKNNCKHLDHMMMMMMKLIVFISFVKNIAKIVNAVQCKLSDHNDCHEFRFSIVIQSMSQRSHVSRIAFVINLVIIIVFVFVIAIVFLLVRS